MISEHLTGQEIIDLRLLHSFIGSPTLYSLILDIKVNFTAKRFHMLNWNNNEVWLQDPYEDSITWPDIFIEGHIFV